MEGYDYLFAIAVILLATKGFGLISQKVHMPQVVGALVAGIVLGPSLLGIVEETDFLARTAEIGVILLMFLAGLETDLEELKQNGVASLIVAVIGVVVPIFGGYFVYKMFFGGTGDISLEFLKAVFIGVTLTATSVSITVETLREMGKLQGRMGTTVLGAAVIDDVVGVIVLTMITSMKDTSVNPVNVIIKIVLFFLFVIAVAAIVLLYKKLVRNISRRRRTSIYVLAFCFLMSYAAEVLFGVADITGAYFAGIILCNFGIRDYVDEKFSVLSYLFFSPIFFASIGINTSLHGMTGNIMLFALVLVVVAILTKVVGCGLGAKFCKFDNKDALSIGVGMVSRGEVALIVAQKGQQVGLLDQELFPAIVLMVIVTTLIAPILLKVVLTDKKEKAVRIEA